MSDERRISIGRRAGLESRAIQLRQANAAPLVPHELPAIVLEQARQEQLERQAQRVGRAFRAAREP